MSGVAFKGGKCTGHSCFPPRESTEGADTVTVNDKPVHCVGHQWAFHTCGDNTHKGALANGSDGVSVEGVAVGRIGDDVTCGSVVAEGSEDTTAG